MSVSRFAAVIAGANPYFVARAGIRASDCVGVSSRESFPADIGPRGELASGFCPIHAVVLRRLARSVPGHIQRTGLAA